MALCSATFSSDNGEALDMLYAEFLQYTLYILGPQDRVGNCITLDVEHIRIWG